MNIETFVAELVAHWHEHSCLDIDGADFQDALIQHGLAIERPATAEEAQEDWAAEFDIEEGDTILANTPEFVALRKRVAQSKKDAA